MTTTETMTATVKDTVADLGTKAKSVYAKTATLAGEATEFSKGNLQAVVESGKILQAGLQELGQHYVADTKAVFETLTADAKNFAAIKSPTEFFKLQSDVLRRNLDAVVTTGTKQSEAIMKLATDSFAPISTRISLAVEKTKKAA